MRNWLARALETQQFHAAQLQKHSRWTLADTAALLNRALGTVSEDLLIVSWLKSHETKIRNFKRRGDAVAFIRERKRELNEQAYGT